jgi:glycerol-3-phosphate acyltransferase PlsY
MPIARSDKRAESVRAHPAAATLWRVATLGFDLPRGAEWIALGASYLLGAVPFGLVLGRVFKGVDIRKAGSGNIGASNAGRVLGRPWGLAVFVLDFLKGVVPSAWIAPALAVDPAHEPGFQVLCGSAAVAGHVWPAWLAFKGGKAVATGAGAIVGIDPVVFLMGGAAYLTTLGLTRFAGLSSLVMSLGFVATAVWRMQAFGRGPELVVGTSGLAFLVFVRHRSNIARMLAGTEPKVGAPKDGASEEEGA